MCQKNGHKSFYCSTCSSSDLPLWCSDDGVSHDLREKSWLQNHSHHHRVCWVSQPSKRQSYPCLACQTGWNHSPAAENLCVGNHDLAILNTQLGGNDRCLMIGENLFISAVSGVFQDMLRTSTPHQSVWGYSVCLGSGTSATVVEMVHVSYPPFCTWETAGQRTTDASRVIGFFSRELSPGLKEIQGEQAAGPKHVQHIWNTTQLQGLSLPMEAGSLPGLVGSPDGDDVLREFLLSFCCFSMNLLGIIPLKGIQPVSIQTMKWKTQGCWIQSWCRARQFQHASWHIIGVHALNLQQTWPHLR